ncbi:MAG: antibiotic biosynthesis monooxygenase [Leptothrix sp. (in: b-proteobacteria)]
MATTTQAAPAGSGAAGNTHAGAVTVLVTRRVKTGHEAAFEQTMGDMIAAAATFAGHLGGQLVRPGEEGGDEPNLYHVVFAFDSAAHLKAWQQSPARSLGLAAVSLHTDGEQLVRQVTGLGHWFAAPVGPKQIPPPRWKVAVVTWLGICPTVFVLFVLLGELLAPWPLLPRVMLLTSLVVILMTWVVAPQLTKLLKPWLYPAAAPTPS